MMRTAVLGAGHYLAPFADRGGISRPIEPAPAGTSTLGLRASTAALANAGSTAADVELIVFATLYPDVVFPGAACFLQHSLGCDTIGALDVRGQCAGFVLALATADKFIRCGQYRSVLAVGAEVHSAWVDYSPRGIELARRFGDGAGALLVGPSADGRGLLETILHTDGSQHERFWCEYPASRNYPDRVNVEQVRAGLHYPKMDVDAVARFGGVALPEVIREVAERAGVGLERIDRFIVSFVLPEVVEKAAGELGTGAARLANPAGAYGHLGAAALPLALSDDLEAGRVGRGSLVCLAAAGAGFMWGAALVEL